MKKYIGSTLLVGVSMVFIWFLIGCKKEPKGIQPAYRNLTEAVYASGNVFAKDEYKIVSSVEGYLNTIWVKEGDCVKEGQVLFTLEGISQSIKSRLAKRIFELAKENVSERSPVLAELSQNVKSLKNKLRNDSVNYTRFLSLKENNATTGLEYDRAVLTYQNAQNEYNAALSRYIKTKNQLEIELQNAQAQYELAAKDQGDYLIKSRKKGIVLEINKERGEMVRRTDLLATIGDLQRPYVRLNVDEQDINKIKLGQQLVLKLDVYKDTFFLAEVSQIFPKLNSQNQSFRVDAIFTQPFVLPYDGLTVEANIMVNEKRNVLTIPKSALVGDDSVIVLEESGERKVKIIKGVEDFEWVEIEQGLTPQSVLKVKSN